MLRIEPLKCKSRNSRRLTKIWPSPLSRQTSEVLREVPLCCPFGRYLFSEAGKNETEAKILEETQTAIKPRIQVLAVITKKSVREGQAVKKPRGDRN